MICEECGEDKEDVKEVLDPYDEEIYGEENLRALCDDCYDQLCNDI